jgi:nifR3 family TIM-barrel protein
MSVLEGYTIRPGLHVQPGLVLAPMEGVTDVTFRRLIRSVGGCGMTFTEFIPAAGLSRRGARELLSATFDEAERPVTLQVFGNDPSLLAEGARVAADLGVSAVDLNMGCPSKRVCAHSGGSSLLREPDLVRAIVQAIRAAVSIPFTAKLRAGWEPGRENAPEIAKICEGEGVEALAVHWRTRQEGYGGTRRHDTIAAVKAAVGIPVLANGDIVDATSAREVLSATGVDGLMVGRGAVRNPWVFHEIVADQRGSSPPVVDDAERLRVLLHYFGSIREAFRTDRGALGRFKKIAKYFTEGVQGGDNLRFAILHSDTPEQAEEAVRRHFGEHPVGEARRQSA